MGDFVKRLYQNDLLLSMLDDIPDVTRTGFPYDGMRHSLLLTINAEIALNSVISWLELVVEEIGCDVSKFKINKIIIDINVCTNMNVIDCIGVDNKKHKCVSWENQALCGTHIKHKMLKRNDNLRYSCYECCY